MSDGDTYENSEFLISNISSLVKGTRKNKNSRGSFLRYTRHT